MKKGKSERGIWKEGRYGHCPWLRKPETLRLYNWLFVHSSTSRNQHIVVNSKILIFALKLKVMNPTANTLSNDRDISLKRLGGFCLGVPSGCTGRVIWRLLNCCDRWAVFGGFGDSAAYLDGEGEGTLSSLFSKGQGKRTNQLPIRILTNASNLGRVCLMNAGISARVHFFDFRTCRACIIYIFMILVVWE